MHIDYPYRIDGRGGTAETTDEEWVHDLVEQVLFTAPGERVNRPTFGSGLLRVVFEPGGDELAAATQFLVQGALQQWIGDLAEVQGVDVRCQDSTLRVTVRFRARATTEPRIAVFTRAV